MTTCLRKSRQRHPNANWSLQAVDTKLLWLCFCWTSYGSHSFHFIHLWKLHHFKQALEQTFKKTWKLTHIPSFLPSAATWSGQERMGGSVWAPAGRKICLLLIQQALQSHPLFICFIAILEMWSGPADLQSSVRFKAHGAFQWTPRPPTVLSLDGDFSHLNADRAPLRHYVSVAFL